MFRHGRFAAASRLPDSHPLCPTAISVQAALDRLADRLGKAGASLARASPPLPDLAQAARLHVEMLTAGRSADLPADVYQRRAEAAEALPADAVDLGAVALRGSTLTHRGWIWASRHQADLRQRCRELFKSFDVVLCPPMPTPAFPHDHSNQDARRLDIDGKRVPYLDQIVWASMATVAGLPATVAPIGHSEDDLPIGVQIIGPYLEDRTTIAFAGLIEREFGGFVAPSAR